MKIKRFVIMLLILLIGFGYFYIQDEVISYEVSEITKINTPPGKTVLVRGIVSKNFNILGKGGYILKDFYSQEIIYVQKDGVSPQLGKKITVRLKKSDLLLLNDDKLSFYKQISD